MHIEAELDDTHAERLPQWQQHLNKPLAEVVAELLARALDETPAPPETEGQKLLRILDEEGLIFWFPRAAWESRWPALRAGETAQRAETAFPRGAWERGPKT